jgi:hypothetical protein
MVGHSPSAGGTTGINTELIPLITVLQTGGVTKAVYDPTLNNDPREPIWLWSYCAYHHGIAGKSSLEQLCVTEQGVGSRSW